MKFNFPIVVRRNTSISLADSLHITYLNKNLNLTVSDNDRQYISSNGLKSFLKKTLLIILNSDDKKNIHIKPPQLIEEAFDFILNKNKTAVIKNVHDLSLNVEIEFISKQHRFGFFEQNLYPFLKIVIFLQIGAETILTIGSLQLTQSGIFKMSNTANEVVSIIEAILAAILGLCYAYTDPGFLFARSLGVVLDDGIISIQNKCSRSSKIFLQKNNLQTKSNCLKAMGGVSKFIVIVFTLSNLWSYSTMDYQETMLLSNAIATTGMLFNPSVIRAVSWTSFVLDQITDPILFFSMLLFCFNIIDFFLKEQRQNELFNILIKDDETIEELPVTPIGDKNHEEKSLVKANYGIQSDDEVESPLLEYSHVNSESESSSFSA